MNSSMKPLVLLHGALGDAGTLAEVGSILATEYTIHIPDLPAHGSRSDLTEPLSPELCIAFLDEFLETHQIRNPRVFGYSFGGYIALAYALKYPGKLDRLLTLGTKFQWDPETAKQETRMLNPDIIEVKVPQFAALLKKRHGEAHWRKVLAQTVRIMTRLGDAPVLTPANVEACTLRVTIARGTEDHMVSESESRIIADALPDGVFMSIDGVPHPIEKISPALIADLIRDALG